MPDMVCTGFQGTRRALEPVPCITFLYSLLMWGSYTKTRPRGPNSALQNNLNLFRKPRPYRPTMVERGLVEPTIDPGGYRAATARYDGLRAILAGRRPVAGGRDR